MIDALRRLHDGSPRVRRWLRRFYARPAAYADWASLLGAERQAWERARAAARGGPRVLVATSVGGFRPGTTLESLLAVALTLRGAEVELLLCDEALPACMEATFAWHEQPAALGDGRVSAHLCGSCAAPGEAVFAPLGLHVHRYSELLAPEARADARLRARTLARERIATLRDGGVAVGEHALAGALRFFARGTLDDEPRGESVLRAYVEAALLAMHAARRLLDARRPEVAVFHHGLYVPQGLIGDAAREQGVRVVNWNPAVRRGRFLFSHGETYHHELMREPTSAWEDRALEPREEAALDAYLASRRRGSEDWIRFHDATEERPAEIARRLGLDPARPWIGLLTNVVWDAQLHYPARAFPDMLDWLMRTIAWFERHPALQLVVRVHPAETRARIVSRQPVEAELARAFERLPANVRVVGPDDPLSTYGILRCCDAALIYGTKAGVELASMGIPVIVAGEAWVRGKGLTHDASDADAYFALLERLPFGRRLGADAVARARRYAWHFFDRRMIPVRSVRPAAGRPLYRVAARSLDALRPGADPGLDTICRGILERRAFIHSAADAPVAR